jgi:acetoin utilization deacetylase AcuC-like enzyme
MGFCYLNQIAIAALEAESRGLKVGVYDFDVHHGNGTEEALRGRAACTFASVHQYPAYPGTGRDSQQNCHNLPMPPWSPRASYVDALTQAFDRILAAKPDVIAVSAGFDAYRGDPLAQEPLEAEDYAAIGTRLRASGIPAFAVLEGGYSDELPELVLSFLEGWSGGPAKSGKA